MQYWVKSCSTAWFNDFLMSVYSDDRWFAHFQIRKAMIVEICNKVRHLIDKQDMRYRKTISVEIHICCCLYKLAKGTNLLACSKQFAIGRSPIGLVIKEVLYYPC